MEKDNIYFCAYFDNTDSNTVSVYDLYNDRHFEKKYRYTDEK